MSLDISKALQHFFGLEVMLHLTCTNISESSLLKSIDALRKIGVENILALRGDPPHGEKAWTATEGGLSHASDLIKLIRSSHGDHFCVGVAGYPEGHLEAPSRRADIEFLKQKVEAGADFVVTQLFYDVNEYFSFVEECRQIGISVPIIPGVMPIHNYDRFKRFTDFCQTKIPDSVTSALMPIADDDAAVKQYGIDFGIELCQTLVDGGAPGIHFYTLNLEESVTQILGGLGLAEDRVLRKKLPWRASTHPGRGEEDVRPIFWSNRPKSYLARTMSWDGFPNGRWGAPESPSFGELNDYYLVSRSMGSETRRTQNREVWGEPSSTQDLIDVFVSFCRGDIHRLPWVELPLKRESSYLSEELLKLNQGGLFTINSQPRVNGESSTHPDFGWGGPDGFVYQKPYLEFFVAADKLDAVIDLMDGQRTWTYQCSNAAGDMRSNVEGRHVNAVTWGVFPGREIVQPTVVDSESFSVWKDEAFQLWVEDWASLYEEDSKARAFLRSVHDSYYLVNVVDNDFVNGDICAPLIKMLNG